MKGRYKRLLALLLCSALIIGALHFTAYAAGPRNGTVPVTVNGSVVGFGGSQWWVIGYDGSGVNSSAGTMTLLSMENLFDTAFNADTVKPVVTDVSPAAGTPAPVLGSITVTFSEPMETSAGSVSLSGGSGTVNPSGIWSEEDTKYAVLYSGLQNGGTYTVHISGFRDKAGNVMEEESSHSFTTTKIPAIVVYEKGLTDGTVNSETAQLRVAEGYSIVSAKNGTHGVVAQNPDNTGQWYYTLREAIDSGDVQGPNIVEDADSVRVSVKDAQGNTFEIDTPVNVVDDVPVLDLGGKDDQFIQVESGAAISQPAGSVNYNFGADKGPGKSLTVSVGQRQYDITGITEAGSAEIRGEFGTLTVFADGSYVCQARPNVQNTAQDSFVIRITDADGDSKDVRLDISVTPAQGPSYPAALFGLNLGNTPGNQYGGSRLQTSTEALYSGPDSRFSDGEKALIQPWAELDGMVYDPAAQGEKSSGTLAGRHFLWPLSWAEAETLPRDTVRGNGECWWLRSAIESETDVAGWVDGQGGLNAAAAAGGYARYGGRPALTLDVSTVLFTSAAVDGKTLPIGSEMQAVTQPAGAIKFTVLDDANLALASSQGPITAKNGEVAHIAYTGAKTGAGCSVSALITDSSTGAPLFYGRLADGAEGTAGLRIPEAAALPEGEYRLLLFNEQVNGNNCTDFASTPVEIPLTVDNAIYGGYGNDSSPTEEAIKQVNEAKDGDTVKLDLPANGKLPGAVLEAAAGEDITLEIDAGNGVTWIIKGTDIPGGKLADLDLKVDAKANTIPVTVLNALTGEKKVLQLELRHNGPFAFPLTLRLEVGKESAGLFANLYFYDETHRTMDFRTAAWIDAKGEADIPFAHASSYAVVLDRESHAPAALPFTDVKGPDWFYEAVVYVCGAGLMSGVSDSAFDPDGAVTRAQLWTVLARMDGADMTGGSPWYAPAQAWAVERGVSDGGDPNGAVTREQLVTMLHRYAQIAGRDVSAGQDTNILSYADALDVAEWAVPAFQWACGAGIVSGTGDAALSPRDGATRAQFAVILQRFFGGTA